MRIKQCFKTVCMTEYLKNLELTMIVVQLKTNYTTKYIHTYSKEIISMYKKKLGCKTSVFRFGQEKVNNIISINQHNGSQKLTLKGVPEIACLCQCVHIVLIPYLVLIMLKENL